ncbi:MAG: serine hydrolase domain-containing protein, partial [Sphingomicrobium sp.]
MAEMRALLVLAVLALPACATLGPAEPAPVAEAGIAFTSAGVVGTFANGFADPKAGRAVTPDDPARVASVSKLVVAIKVMQLVEAGKLDLDADVSDYLGWRLRNPAFPDRPISLRMLLSHTSSARDHDDQYAIPLGETVQAAMADPASWDPAHGPGDRYFTYSNMNFPIIASVIESVTQDRFDGVMRRDVLDPMGVDACFNWPTCTDSAVARVVVLIRDGEAIRDDLGGKRPDCPVYAKDGEPCDLARWKLGENGALFSPQGGLRISVRGLARVGRMLLNRGTLDGKRILGRKTVDLMTANHMVTLPNNQAATRQKGFGLGVEVTTDLGQLSMPSSIGQFGWY